MPRLFLAGTLIVSTALGFCTLTTGHNWGDDFAQYLLQAQSVAYGTTREFIECNRFAVDNSTQIIGPHVYRWGYPLCLAPFFRSTACDLLTMKCLNLLFFELTLLCVYALFAPRLGRATSCLLTAMLAFNPNLLAFLDNLLSDVPFLFLAVFSLYLIDRLVVRGEDAGQACQPDSCHGKVGLKSLAYVFLGVSIFAATLVRANGVLLLPVLFVCQILDVGSGSLRMKPLSWRSLPVSAIPYAVFLVLKCVTGSLLPDGSAGYAGVAASHVSWWGIGDNSIFYLGLISMLFGVVPEKEIVFALSLPFLFLGMKARWRHDFPWLAFCLANHFLYVVWPGRGNMRFIMPMMPFYLYFMFQGAAFLWTKRFCADGQMNRLAAGPSRWRAGGYIFAALLGASFLAESACFAYQNMCNDRRVAGPYDDDSTEMFDYVKRDTETGARLLFFKPRAMLLLTGRQAFASSLPEDLARVDYQVIHKKFDPCNQVRAPASGADKVFENGTFVIYRLRPSLVPGGTLILGGTP